MADRDASVRLNLAASGMLSMLQMLEKESGRLAKEIGSIGEESKKTERKLSPMMESARKGLGAAKKSVMDLGASLKSTLGTALTLGGALSFGAAIKEAVDLTSHYKDVAFAIRTGTGEAMRWEQVQEKVEKTAGRWKRSNAEVARSFDELFRGSSDVNFAEKAAEASAKFARATGKGMSLFAGIADQLRDKFDVAADDIEEAMARIVSTNKVEEFAGSMDVLGSSARSLGLSGKEGLSQVVGMLEATGGATKDLKASISGLSGVLESLNDPGRGAAIEKALKVKLRTDDGELRKDALEQVLKASGGQKEELSKVFSGDSLKIMTEYGKIYSKAFDSTAGNFKTKSEAGMDAFNKALKDAAKSKLSVADITAEAENRNKDPKAQLQDAMNKFTNAFAQPKLISAVEKLADKAPAIADAFAKVVDFAADNPILAGTAFVGGKAAMAMGGSMASDAGSAVFERTLGKLGGKLFTPKDATAAGEAMAKAGGWGNVGKLLGAASGVAIAGYIAHELGTWAIDQAMEKKGKAQNSTVLAGVEAAGAASSGDLNRMLAARSELSSRVQEMEKDTNSFGHRVMRGIGRTFVDKDFKTGDDQIRLGAKQDLLELEQAIARTRAATEQDADATEKSTRSQERLAQSAERTARALDRIGSAGGTGTNGLPPPPGVS